jgi:hypothetical protein
MLASVIVPPSQMKKGRPESRPLACAVDDPAPRLARLGCMPLAQGAEARAPQITGRLLQVLAFKCLSVYQLTILPCNYLYSAVLAAL